MSKNYTFRIGRISDWRQATFWYSPPWHAQPRSLKAACAQPTRASPQHTALLPFAALRARRFKRIKELLARSHTALLVDVAAMVFHRAFSNA